MKFQKITYFKKQDNLYCVCCIDTFKIKTIDYEKFSKIKNKYIMLSSSKDVNKKTLKDYTQNQFLKEYTFLKNNNIDIFEYYSYSGAVIQEFIKHKRGDKDKDDENNNYTYSFFSGKYDKVLYTENKKMTSHNNGGYVYNYNGEYSDAFTVDFDEFYPNCLISSKFKYPQNSGEIINLDFYSKDEKFKKPLTIKEFKELEELEKTYNFKFQLGYYNVHYIKNSIVDDLENKQYEYKTLIYPYDFEAFFIDDLKNENVEKVLYINYEGHYIYNENKTKDGVKNKNLRRHNQKKLINNGKDFFKSFINKIQKLQKEYKQQNNIKNYILKRFISSFAGVLSKKNYEDKRLKEDELINYSISHNEHTEYIIIESKLKRINDEEIFLFSYLDNKKSRKKYNFRFYPFLIAFSRLVLLKTVQTFKTLYYEKYKEDLQIVRIYTDSITVDRNIEDIFEIYNNNKNYYKVKIEDKTSGHLIIYNNRIKRRCSNCEEIHYNSVDHICKIEE
jgi:hypothetical protein